MEIKHSLYQTFLGHVLTRLVLYIVLTQERTIIRDEMIYYMKGIVKCSRITDLVNSNLKKRRYLYVRREFEVTTRILVSVSRPQQIAT